MKKINLIEWLWKTDSHEKQKPQRFARYAAMLIMLLTLGVGQMWAAWIGNSGIYVNGTWYKCSSNVDGGNWLSGKTSFNNLSLGGITSLELGGQYDSYDNSQTDYCSWNSSNGIHILIKKSSTQIASFKLSCFHSGKSGNNNVWKTYGEINGCSDSNEGWGTYSVDISAYAPGTDYTIKATWFSPSGQSLNNTATFSINPLVTFKANGGSGSDYTQRVTYNTNTALTSNTFTRSGYTFAGWATSADGNVVYTNGATVKLTAHTTLYAKWNVQTYTVTYDGNGNTGGTAPTDASSPYTSGSTVTVKTAGNLAKTGCTFGGWMTAKDGSGTTYAPGATFSITANTKLYARWISKTIYVYDNLNWGAMKLYTWDSGNKTYNGAWPGQTLSQIGSTKWYKVEIVSGPNKFILNSGSGTQTNDITIDSYSPSIVDGHSYETYGTGQKKDLREKKFTVTFNMKSHGDEVSSQSVYYNGLVTEPSPAPTADHYSFGGWYSNSTCTTAWNFSTGKITADRTLYAKWTEVTHAVRAHYGTGGSAVTPSSWTNYGEVTGGAVSATNATGYHFDGWTIDDSKGGSFADASSASTTFYPVADNTWITAHFAPNTYSITLDKNGGDSDGSATATYNSATLAAFSGASRAGYTCDGYFDDPDPGEGNMIIDASGNLQLSKSGYTNASGWTKTTTPTTLYAHWTENLVNYTVTYAVKSDQTSLGTLSCATTVGSTPISSGGEVASGTGVTFTASPITGYEVDAWCSNEACTSPIAGAGYANTYSTTVSANTAVYVKFKKKIYTITYSPSSAPTGCTYTTKPTTGTYGNTVTMVITPSTGYTVSVSARDASSNVVTISNPSANTYTFTQPASAVTVTVTATEVKSSVTVTTENTSAGTLTFGSTSKSWNTSASVGVTTGQSITATASTGFTFVRWELSGAATSTSTLTNNTITIKANGTGNSGTATAIFEEDLTQSTWVLKGGTNITGDNWANEHALNKKPGHSAESVVYYVANITSTNAGSDDSDAYSFKIVKKGASDSWYGIGTGGGNEWWYDRSKGEQTMATNTKNIQIIADVVGDYEIKVDYSDASNPKVTITFPPTLTFSATSVYADGTSTLTASVSNIVSGKTLKYDVYAGATATGEPVATYSTTTTTTTDSHAFSITPSFGASDKVQYTVKITYNGTQTATYTGIIGRKWDIYVHDVQSWGMMKLYMWKGSSHNATYPGAACSSYNGSSSWYTVTLDGQYSEGFVLSANGDATKSTNHSMSISSFGAGTYWYVDKYKDGTLRNLSLSDPTVTLSATITNTNQINLTGNITNFGGDGSRASDMQEVYFHIAGTKNAATATSTTDGTFTKTISNATAGTTNTLQAFAENIHGTGSSSVLHYTNVTLDRQSGTTGTTAVTAVENMAMPAGATAPGKTGYAFGGYYESTGGANRKYYNADMSSANTWNKTGKDVTIYAKWTPITYTIHFNGNGNTSGSMSDQTGVTYDAATTITANAFVKTGYNFAGWATTEDRANAGTVDRIDGAAHSNLASTQGATAQLWAVWTPKQCTVTFDYQLSTEGHGNAGTLSNVTATYDAAMPALTGNMPTAANGYAFMGFFSETGGNGTKYYNPDKTSAHNWDVDAETTQTLYAYYKKAEITGITFSPATIVAPSTTITATPTISPTPTGTHIVCWEVQYSNGTALPSQPTFIPSAGNAVSFTVPAASATYKLQATLKTGNSCAGGTELSVYSATFQVAGDHTVTVRYQDSEGRTIKASTEITGKPLVWTTLGDITPPEITGYTFDHWDAGDGVTIKNGDSDPVTTTTTSSIQIKAVYDGTLTAVYNKKNMIFFNNTLNWDTVYVYFYEDGKYWSDTYGTGANQDQQWTGSNPYWFGEHGGMKRVSPGSNIWYFDYTAAGYTTHRSVVAFANKDQSKKTNCNGDNDCIFFSDNAKVVRRSDHNTSLPMFVPLADQSGVSKNSGHATYYNNGYWMNYPENTGYTLKIYNAWNVSKETGAVQSIAFPYSEDKTMPLKMDVELSDGYNHEYWFMVYRNDGVYLGGLSHFKQGSQAEQVITGGDNKEKITTSAPGDYTFTLTYHDNGSGTVNYYIDVDFPIATGDYRIYYSDNATWSKAAHTKDSWCHPSHSIAKIDGEATEAKKDTVSFYIPKGEGILHTMKFQKASVTNDGVVSWSDVDGGGITIPSSVNATGVYNFIVSQPAGGASISLEKVEPYTGNFYIRTDCAGNTKWDSFKNLDHQMTYSDYAENNSGYSHYYTHWVTNGTNVKFVVANDYSMCISDTLVEDIGTVIADITTEGNANAGRLNSGNANIRFMWNQSTNQIKRAYISGSGTITDRFLVLEGDAKMYDENGHALTETYQDHDQYGNYLGTDNQVILHDDENFLYERTIQVNATARAKLTAEYNGRTQFFKGAEGAFAEGTTVQLLGGAASDAKHNMRIVYDFKTNRLVTAYMPSSTNNITDDMPIEADLMIVREHQGEGQQLVFNGGSLSKVHTVYGVMRFNRWTLNNKDKDTHNPVDDPKSPYERALYWISFPFDVNLSDVFGFGTYGTHWIIEEYDGKERAEKGYWADSEGFWTYIWDRRGVTLEKGRGYVLALDLDLMKDGNEEFWANNIQQVELFFPSATYVSDIEATDVTTSAEAHLYDKSAHSGHTDDRTKADSHWNMIGVPSYANYDETLASDDEGTVMITWNENPKTDDLPFLYEWNMVDDTYTVKSGTTYPFKSMHAYMVQYYGDIYWSMASATPTTPSSVARRSYEEAPKNVEFLLELQQNDKMTDQTIVKLSSDEEVSEKFVFNEDMSKEFNSRKANIYTIVENYIPTAGNTLPMTEQTTIVPVGVKIAKTGDYTFAIPSGTSGVGVTLVDLESGVRTNLALFGYDINLEAGDYNDRFMLEISPVQPISQGIDEANGEGLEANGVRKVLIDNIMYIIRDGKVFDAQGKRLH